MCAIIRFLINLGAHLIIQVCHKSISRSPAWHTGGLMGPPTILKTWNTRETVARSRYPRKVSLYVCSHLASLPSLGKSLLREVCVRMVQSVLSSNRVNACFLSTRVIGKMILISCLSCRKRAEKISFWPCCNRNGEEGRDALFPPTYFSRWPLSRSWECRTATCGF